MTAQAPMVGTLTSEERSQRFAQLYEEAFPLVARFVANRGGSFQDARDIFHDALVILYEKIVYEKFLPGISEERYVLGIAKHLWLRKFKSDLRQLPLEESEESITIPDEYFDNSENRLTSLLELTGRKCMELLRAVYYDNLSMQKVRQAFGFSTAHSASVQKHKCIGKMRAIVQQKSMDYEDFA